MGSMMVRRGLLVLVAALLAAGGIFAWKNMPRAEPASVPGASSEGEPAPTNREVEPAAQLASISPAIPVYAGAEFNGDLTRRDNATVANRYGDNSRVYTLTTRDSFPQVWHYYVTYLAQFRSFEPVRPFPPSNQIARSIEVRLNEAMQDPFIPGDSLELNKNRVVLQVSEADGGAGTIIRYIIGPPQPPPVSVAEVSRPDDAPPAPGTGEQVEGP